MNRAAILHGLEAKAESRQPIIVAGVGCGLTAAGAVAGGADLLATYSTAVYRKAGLPTVLSFMPYDDPNRLTFAAIPEILANAGACPLIVGLGAHDPRRPPERLLDEARQRGVAGVTNEPFSGIYGPALRAELERAGCGFAREVALIEQATARGLLTLAWVFDPEQARAMATVGASLIGAMLGFSAPHGDADPARESEAIAAMAAAAWAVRSDVLVLAHGGSLTTPDAVRAMRDATGIHGYVTGSSGERQPVIRAVAATLQSYKST